MNNINLTTSYSCGMCAAARVELQYRVPFLWEKDEGHQRLAYFQDNKGGCFRDGGFDLKGDRWVRPTCTGLSTYSSLRPSMLICVLSATCFSTNSTFQFWQFNAR